MRGPACVCNASEARQIRLVDLHLEVGHARGAARALQHAVDMQGNAARIVSTVFEPFQALQQNRGDIALRDRADDATHKSSFRKFGKSMDSS